MSCTQALIQSAAHTFVVLRAGGAKGFFDSRAVALCSLKAAAVIIGCTEGLGKSSHHEGDNKKLHKASGCFGCGGLDGSVRSNRNLPHWCF